MTTKQIFCAHDQATTTHTLTVDSINGEIIATCPCGRFLKFPPTVTPESFNELVAAHQAANKGQVSLEQTEALVSSLGDNENQTQA